MSRGALCVFLNLGSYLVLKGNLTAGFLFSISTEAFRLVCKINSFISFENEQHYLESDDKIFEMIDLAQTVPFTNEGKEIQNFSGRIEFIGGGQKQRIAIARAVIRDPIVMITDEETSELDVENERKVQKALDIVMDGKTSIIIDHRLGTIKAAKTIYVFDSREMLESGIRDELIEKKGFFISW